MSAVLERMRSQAVLLDRREMKYEPIVDVCELAQIEARDWKRAMAAIEAGGDPSALLGNIAGTEGNIPNAALAAVTGGTANVKWWDGLIYSPIYAGLVAPKTYECFAEGTVTSSAGSQTLLPNPAISTGAVGTNLTACPAAQTLGTTITGAIWSLFANITVRTSGSGTAATAVGQFEFKYTVLANGGAPTSIIWRSTANATFDSTVLNAFVFGATPSAAGVSVTPQQIRWGSWN